MNAHEVHPYLVMLLLLIQILVIIYETILSILNVTGSVEVFFKATPNESAMQMFGKFHAGRRPFIISCSLFEMTIILR